MGWLACSIGLYQTGLFIISLFACIIAYEVILIILGAICVYLTNPEKLRQKINKQDERRYMPKEMLQKP